MINVANFRPYGIGPCMKYEHDALCSNTNNAATWMGQMNPRCKSSQCVGALNLRLLVTPIMTRKSSPCLYGAICASLVPSGCSPLMMPGRLPSRAIAKPVRQC